MNVHTVCMIVCAILFVFISELAFALPISDLEAAEQFYLRTQYQEALQVLGQSKSSDSAIFALSGKCYYMLGDYKKATESFEKAVAMAPNNAEVINWLGKAYGRRAETSSFLTAPRYASQTRQFFERAVQLDRNNLEAVDDLFEYYKEAPGFLGGGEDKAQRLAEQLRDRAPSKYHSLLARMAEKKKQLQEAEQHFHKAAELAPDEEGRLVDLAVFLARNKRYQESEKIMDQASAIAPNSQSLKFERAKIYIESGHNMGIARNLLNEYINSSSLTPDDPPRSEARQLLAKTSQ